LAGGLSHERDVSLRSGRRLAADLRDVGMVVSEWDVDATLLDRLSTEGPEAVVVALHGGDGENGAVQSVLEMLRVPFVGSARGRAGWRGTSRPPRRSWRAPDCARRTG
jgi:D-alanine-D-alanine ligase